MPAYLANKLA